MTEAAEGVTLEKETEKKAIQELCLFRVGDIFCGLDITKVQEINKNLIITRVPRAPDYVRGIVNLRGQIVTLIELRKKFGIPGEEPAGPTQIIVVMHKDENVGLIVDSVDTVITVNPDYFEASPANLSGVKGEYFSRVYKSEGELVAVLNIDVILKE